MPAAYRRVFCAARVFELKGRIGDRIRVGTADIYPADVARVLDSVEGAGHIFQMVISKKAMKDHVEVHVERSSRYGHVITADAVKDALLGELAEAREALEQGWIEDFVVDLVPHGSLQGMRRTGKIRAVIDHRS